MPSALAWAKLNLHLDVGPRCADGYHSLVSLVQQVSLADRLQLEVTPATNTEVEFHLLGQLNCSAEENLAVRAARLFLQEGGFSARIVLHLQKCIPAGAGLGGGSSDAAAVLKLLNSHYQVFDQRQLQRLALQLGSDVPLFLSTGAFVVTGRGEHLSPLPNHVGLSYLIAVPTGWFCSTVELFKLLDERRSANFRGYSHCTSELEQFWLQGPEKWSFHNDFAAMVGLLYPQLPDYLESFRLYGAKAVGVSGTGAALWGVYDSVSACREGQERLMADYDCWSTVATGVLAISD